jgi:hypothetical protein
LNAKSLILKADCFKGSDPLVASVQGL